jgi:hypothetical protein
MMNIFELFFVILTWLWVFKAFTVKETHQLLFNGKVVVSRNNKKLSWALLVLTIFNTASFIFFSVIAA